MKKFNFRKVLDGLTAASPVGSSGSGSGAGGGSVYPGGTAGTAGTPREEIQETLTSDYFQICKVKTVFLYSMEIIKTTLGWAVGGEGGGSNMIPISVLL